MPDVNFAKKAVINVQKRSAFDKSFRNLLTTKCGTLTPLMCDEVIPNTTANLKLAINCTLPPLASETFMNVNLKVEAFFCPTRLMMLGFEDFIQGKVDLTVRNLSSQNVSAKLHCPVVKIEANSQSGSSGTTTLPYITPGSLADYFGFRADQLLATTDQYITMFPFLCYHLIYDSWYRNPLIQQSPFDDNDYIGLSSSWTPRAIKYKKPNTASVVGYSATLNYQFKDGVKLGELRQRNFGSDYFTMANPTPQNGAAQKIVMSLPQLSTIGFDHIQTADPLAVGSSGYAVPDYSSVVTQNKSGEVDVSYFTDVNGDPITTSFTISSLRACNSLQQFLERNQLSNDRYVDFLKVQYNADLKDSIAQRPVYLGSASFPVYSKGVYQTAADSNSGNNPFDSVGSRYGHAYAEGSSFIIDHFTASEPGYIMVLATLVPEVSYASGVPAYLRRYLEPESYGEIANPILQNVGPQPVYASELVDGFDDTSNSWVFGYVDRFADWMTRNHEVHGLLRDGQSLEAFALQRSMSGQSWQIGSQFLKIPSNYMDQVTAVTSAISNYGCWIDSYLDYKVVMPLGRYVIPSLQDPAYEHGDTIVVNRRGSTIE